MTERERRRSIVDHLRSGKTEDAAAELDASRENYPGDGMLHHAIGVRNLATEDGVVPFGEVASIEFH